MTNTTVKMMIAAAALAVAAGAASAQGLKADVPFKFSTGNKVLSAGTYAVTLDVARRLVNIRNISEKGSASLLAYNLNSMNVTGEAKLVFSCSDGMCDLMKASTGEGGFTYNVSHPHAKTGATLLEIKLHR